jgi:signal transduction histidine kinase
MMSFLFAFQSDVDRWRFPAGLLAFFPTIEWLAPLLFAVCFFLLFYLFPDGRFTPRWIGLFGIAGAGVSLIFFASLENVVGISEEVSWFLFIFSNLSIAFVGLISQAIKWRSATLLQKQQTRLVLIALVTFISLPFLQAFAANWFPNAAWGHFISLHLFLIGATLIPLAIGVSVLRYRLWQMDVLLNRTLVYGGLTAVIILLYILVVGAAGVWLHNESNVLWAVFMTGLIAVLVNPLRQRLQTAVNRLMYGERDDPITVLTALGRRLEETAVPTEILPVLVQTIRQSLKLPYVAVTGKRNDEFDVLAAAGAFRQTPLQTLPLIYQSEMIGQLLIAPRTPDETFNPAEMRLLENVARQAGTAVYAAQLTADLQRSREQLITAREEERRRIHRDLHDGLGPQLATLNLKVDAIRNQLTQPSETAAHLLDDLKSDIQNAINDIRRLVHDLRPPALDQLGLVSALQEYVAQQNGNGRLHNRQLSMIFHAPDSLPPLPAAVEVAAYRIALEAITNVVHHAQAQNCQIHLRMDNSLQLEIRDNGVGLPIGYQAGIGLLSMRERAVELGGSCQIDSIPGHGTLIFVQLPLSQAA